MFLIQLKEDDLWSGITTDTKREPIITGNFPYKLELKLKGSKWEQHLMIVAILMQFVTSCEIHK